MRWAVLFFLPLVSASVCNVEIVSNTSCVGSTSFSFGSNVKIIEDEAFYNKSITHVDFTDASRLVSIGKMAFYSNKLTSVDTRGATQLQEVGDFAFASNPIIEIFIDNDNFKEDGMGFGVLLNTKIRYVHYKDEDFDINDMNITNSTGT